MLSIRKYLIETARLAAEIALSHRRSMSVDKKLREGRPDDYDIVTSADLASEELILSRLAARYPEYEIISEERCPNNNVVPDNWFVIDPIDGTINFANRFPLWGIQIACIQNGETIASVICAPEIGRTWSADKAGAYLNEEKISVSDTPLASGLYSIDGADRICGRKALIEAGNYNLRDFYSCCIAFAMVASGTSVAAAYIDDHLWDYLPGQFIVKQAGGVYFDDDKKNIHIVANTQAALDEMKECFEREWEGTE